MDSETSSAAAGSKSDNSKTDPIWKHVRMLKPQNTNDIVCNSFDKVTKGGIYQAKKRLVGGFRNVTMCRKRPALVCEEMQEYMKKKVNPDFAWSCSHLLNHDLIKRRALVNCLEMVLVIAHAFCKVISSLLQTWAYCVLKAPDVMNPNKLTARKFLIRLHEHSDKIIVFSPNLFALMEYQGKLQDRMAGGKEQYNAFFYSHVSTDAQLITSLPLPDSGADLNYYHLDEQLALSVKVFLFPVVDYFLDNWEVEVFDM
ncbi:hypothetical protein GH714_003798 [Hevea brasiliensis]|uniref:ERCC3/RAD25/XPB helicase C-terminal domain-containing protein n=1 Tax=Hevea brasiliensis TaxID=3981 RepID=A0A6A6LBA3_HEVBR|nr:hypothetical protein GH714_003798 [Hevea brasiliensis]